MSKESLINKMCRKCRKACKQSTLVKIISCKSFEDITLPPPAPVEPKPKRKRKVDKEEPAV